jgi:hypothetical protein
VTEPGPDEQPPGLGRAALVAAAVVAAARVYPHARLHADLIVHQGRVVGRVRLDRGDVDWWPQP